MCAGGSLATRLYGSESSDKKSSADSGLKLDAKFQIALDVSSALSFLHSGGPGQKEIFHRDLKPENIMLVRFCCVRVLFVAHFCCAVNRTRTAAPS